MTKVSFVVALAIAHYAGIVHFKKSKPTAQLTHILPCACTLKLKKFVMNIIP